MPSRGTQPFIIAEANLTYLIWSVSYFGATRAGADKSRKNRRIQAGMTDKFDSNATLRMSVKKRAISLYPESVNCIPCLRGASIMRVLSARRRQYIYPQLTDSDV